MGIPNECIAAAPLLHRRWIRRKPRLEIVMRTRSAVLVLAFAAAASLGYAQAQSCISDEQCQDGSWCNGLERCEGGVGNAMCMPAQRPMCPMKKACDEATRKCIRLDAARKDHKCPEGQAYSVSDQKCVATPPPR